MRCDERVHFETCYIGMLMPGRRVKTACTFMDGCGLTAGRRHAKTCSLPRIPPKLDIDNKLPQSRATRTAPTPATPLNTPILFFPDVTATQTPSFVPRALTNSPGPPLPLRRILHTTSRYHGGPQEEGLCHGRLPDGRKYTAASCSSSSSSVWNASCAGNAYVTGSYG
jgi:hypothetical protein